MLGFLIYLAIAAGLFLALPWLVIGFNRYCDTVNRYVSKAKAKPRE